MQYTDFCQILSVAHFLEYRSIEPYG